MRDKYRLPPAGGKQKCRLAGRTGSPTHCVDGCRLGGQELIQKPLGCGQNLEEKNNRSVSMSMIESVSDPLMIGYDNRFRHCFRVGA